MKKITMKYEIPDGNKCCNDTEECEHLYVPDISMFNYCKLFDVDLIRDDKCEQCLLACEVAK